MSSTEPGGLNLVWDQLWLITADELMETSDVLNQVSDASGVQQNAAALFYCDAPELFCDLHHFTWLSIIIIRRKRGWLRLKCMCVCVWPCVSLWQSPRTCQCFWLVQTERRPVWWCPLPAHSKWSPRKLDTWWPELSDAGRLPEHTHTHGKSNYNNTPEDHQDQNQDHSGPGLNQDVDLLRIRKQKL